MSLSRFFTLTSLILLCSSALLLADKAPGDSAAQAQFDTTIELALRGYPHAAEKELTTEEIEKKAKKKPWEIEMPEPTPRQTQKALLGAISKCSFLEDLHKERSGPVPAVDKTTYECLHLFHGSASKPEASLLQTMVREGHSELEKTGLAMAFTYPTTNVTKLKELQRIIQIISTQPEIRDALLNLYTRLAKVLPRFASLTTASDPLWAPAYKKILHTSFKFISSWPVMEFKKRVTFDLGFLNSLLIITLGVAALFSLLLPDDTLQGLINQSAGNTKKLIVLGTVMFMKSSPLIVGYYLFIGGLAVVTFHMLLTALKGFHSYIGSRLADVRELLLILRDLITLLEKHSELQQLCRPYVQHSLQLVYLTHPDSEVNSGLESFFQNNFSANWGLFFNSTATLLTAMAWLEKHRSVFYSALAELAYVSTFLTVAELVRRTAATPNGYCYVDYLEAKKGAPHKPTLALDGVWHPFTSPQSAVPNDLQLGDQTRSVVLVGPNACGKSTILESSMVAALTAQTFGVAPAKSMTCTPFAIIMVNKKAEDDIARGISTYAAELLQEKRKKALQTYCKEQNCFMLLGSDESIKGTNPTEGEALEAAIHQYDLKEYRGHMVSIVSTHNPFLVKYCMDDPDVKVYTVLIQRHSDNSYTPLYKIGPAKVGVSPEKVGIDLYEKTGGRSEIVKEARKMVIERQKQNPYV